MADQPLPPFLLEPANQPRQKALFQKKKQPEAPSIAPFIEQLNTVSRRLRVLEERDTTLRRRIQVIEQNMINIHKKNILSVKTLGSDINEIKREISDIRDKILQIISEIKKAARREELDMLKKYVDMWEPINFVTQDEVEKIVKDILAKNK